MTRSRADILEAICQNIPDGICMIDQDWIIRSWNRGAETMLGYSADEIIGVSIATIIPADIARREIEHCTGELERAGVMTAYRTLRVHKDGAVIPIELTAVAIRNGTNTGYASIMRDITESKRLEDALTTSEANLRTIFNSTRDAIIIHDLEGNIIDINDRMPELYGLTREQALHSSIPDLSAPENGPNRLRGIWDMTLAGRSSEFEWTARRPLDGATFPVNVFLRRITLKRTDAILAVIRDISDRKRAEEALKLTQFSVDHASIPVLLIERDARILYVNEQTCRTLGYTREEILAMTVHDIDPHFPAARWPAHWMELRTAGTLRFETEHRKKDGTLVPVDLTVNYVSFGGREYNWAFAVDISDRKRAEAELKQAYAVLEEKVRDRTRELAQTNEELRIEVGERRRAVEVIKRSQELSNTLNDLNAVIHSSLDFEEIMKQVVREATEALQVDASMIGIFEGEVFRVRYVHNLPDSFTSRTLTAKELRAMHHVAQAGEPLAFNDAFHDNRLNTVFTRQVGIRSLLVAPLFIKQKITGALTFYGLEHHIRFDDEHLSFARKLSTSVSLALENAQLYRELEESRRQTEAHLAELRNIYETAPVGLCFLDRNKRYVSINRRLAEINERPIEDHVGRSITDVINDRSAAETIDAICTRAIGSGLTIENVEIVRNRESGLTVLSNFYPVKDTAGRVIGLNIVVQDISVLKRTEDKLRASERLLTAMLNSIPDIAWLKDRDGRFIMVNEPFSMASGKRPELLIGKTDFDAWPRWLAERYVADDQAVMLSRETKRVEEPLAVKHGPERWIETIKTCIVNERDEVVGTAGISRDITDRKRMEEEIRHMAQHDSLTGLPNRRMFIDILNLEIAQARRHESKLAVLFLDLDRFKDVNDTLGHEAGDRLLKVVAFRLRRAIRESDTVARIGGDEFNVVLSDLGRAEDASAIARKIVESMARPFSIAGHDLQVTASIGISIFPDDGTKVDMLLRYADIAMYHAKESGRNGFRFYNPSINVLSLQRMKLAGYLAHAIRREELTMLYQPQIDIRSRAILHAEALVRWNHPDQGMLSPDQFIPLAQETGFITEIDDWVLRAVCRQVRAWKDQGLNSFCVSVNLSARRFQSADLVSVVSSAIAESGLPHVCLGLEVTESAIMNNVERTASQLQELRRMGIPISIDDFGTGYSSLSYLKKLPIDRLKIDKSFIRDIARDSDDRAIISAVTSMARKMGIRTVAEGVETEEQLSFLRESECDEAQGFLFSRPVTAEKFKEFVDKR